MSEFSKSLKSLNASRISLNQLFEKGTTEQFSSDDLLSFKRLKSSVLNDFAAGFLERYLLFVLYDVTSFDMIFI